MTQLNIDMISQPDKISLNSTKIHEFGSLSVGSYLNTPYSDGPLDGIFGFIVSECRARISKIQAIAMETGEGIPILYGIDSVHGANYISNAVMFPQQINAAASFNPSLVFEMGRITGKDTEAAGIPWIFA